MSSYRRTPTRAWLKRWPQQNRKRLPYQASARPARPVPIAALEGDMKYHDAYKALTALTASTDWTNTEYTPSNGICIPAPGSTISQRTGRHVYLYKIKIRGTITTIPTGFGVTDDPTKMRIILVQDTQTNAAAMQGEDLMDSPGTTALEAVDSFQSLTNLGRFRVLKDKNIIIQNPNYLDASNPGGKQMAQFKFTYKPKSPIKITFNANSAGSIGDVVDNSFHVLANCSDVDLVPRIEFVSRASFKG